MKGGLQVSTIATTSGTQTTRQWSGTPPPSVDQCRIASAGEDPVGGYRAGPVTIRATTPVSAGCVAVRLIETHLMTLTSSLSSTMTRVFQALTATEADVAHLVMRGLTTKDIAATLSRAPSRIDFHRHNIPHRAARHDQRRLKFRESDRASYS